MDILKKENNIRRINWTDKDVVGINHFKTFASNLANIKSKRATLINDFINIDSSINTIQTEISQNLTTNLDINNTMSELLTVNNEHKNNIDMIINAIDGLYNQSSGQSGDYSAIVKSLTGSFIGTMSRNSDGTYSQSGDKAIICDQVGTNILNSYDIHIRRELNMLHIVKLEFTGVWDFGMLSPAVDLVNLRAFFSTNDGGSSIPDNHEVSASIYVDVSGVISGDVFTLPQYSCKYFKGRPGAYRIY